MHVIAGSLKGCRLKAPTWKGLRPTSDKLRETLFNVIAPMIEGARVLDGYAGTGAIGLEALSRGASEVIFIDHDRRAQALIADNLARCRVTSGCVIIRDSVVHAIEALRRKARRFDLVVLDPPYDMSPDDAIAPASAVLASGGALVLEHAERRSAPERAGGLVRTRQIVSGDSALTFYSCLP